MSLFINLARAADAISESQTPYDSDGEQFTSDRHTKAAEDTVAIIKDTPVKFSDLPAFWDAFKNSSSVGLDDRELLLEKILVLMSRFKNTELSVKMQQAVINLLYNDLPHPPGGFLSTFDIQTPATSAYQPNARYVFRSADGSNYNPLFPSLGKAGTPYARSVPSTRSMPRHALPDPGLVFDTLLRRGDKFVEHPGGISSLFFAYADLIIHSIFDTSHADYNINNSSSYLDLSILYGSSEETINEIRRKDGTGMIHNDVFADTRLLLMPPASCALLVLFSRNHNYIAQKLLDINENETFKDPRGLSEKERIVQDDELFHRARMVNCGYFVQVILGDYVGTILRLVEDESDWRLNPYLIMRDSDHKVAPRGEGNVVSIEFNLLYRWHSTLSKQDAEWTEQEFQKFFKGKDLSKVTVDDFHSAIRTVPRDNGKAEALQKRTFGGLTRDSNGRFKDEDLANLIQNATEWRAGAFQARGIPAAMRVIEILGIEQSRSWGTCSLNEFRKFLGLKPYKNFREWNPDEEIHKAAAALYKDIDNLELHVGLQAEQAKEPGPGAGLCPGYTISRAILADAVCLTRGDRFLTTDFTPANLTNWGYDDCQYDTKDGSYGGLLPKLLFRTLPDFYPAGSAYAHFPFLVPTYLEGKMSKKVARKYNWKRPIRATPTVEVNGYAEVKKVLTGQDFISAYNERLFNVAKYQKGDWTLSSEAVLTQGRRNVEELLSGGDWAKYFKQETLDLIADKSIKNHGQAAYVDIVHDVINLLPIHWIAEEIIGLPLKTATNQVGIWREQNTYERFADIAHYVFLNFDAADDWHLRESSIDTWKRVYNFTLDHLESISSFSSGDVLHHGMIESRRCHDFLTLALDKNTGASVKVVAASVAAAIIPTSALFSQAIAHVVNFYIDDDRKKERDEIVRLTSKSALDEEATRKVMGYVHEALRLDPPVFGVYRTAAKKMAGPITAEAQERIFASIVDANLDPRVFGENPSLIAYDRPESAAGLLGLEEHGLLASRFFESTVPTIVGTILGLKNVKRASGVSGELTRFKEDWHGSTRQSYLDSKGKVTPFPDALVLHYD